MGGTSIQHIYHHYDIKFERKCIFLQTDAIHIPQQSNLFNNLA